MTTTKTTLTKRQQEIYDFIDSHIKEKGYGPSVRDIGVRFGIRSPNGVVCHLKALEKKDVIERDENISRGIRLKKQGCEQSDVTDERCPLQRVLDAGYSVHAQQSGGGYVANIYQEGNRMFTVGPLGTVANCAHAIIQRLGL